MHLSSELCQHDNDFFFRRDMKFIVKMTDCQLLKKGSDVCYDRVYGR